MNFELIYIIANYKESSKIISASKECGISGATVFKAKGTVQNVISNFFSLNDERKEVILIATDSITAKKTCEFINQKFKMYKKDRGIIFTVPLFNIVGTNMNIEKIKYNEGENTMFEVIFTIVNKGFAEDVIEAARLVGSKGGTIINAKGSGSSETSKIFNIEIDPEKEIVMIISKKEKTNDIVNKIKEMLDIEKPGNGVIFVQNIKDVYGINV